MRHKYATRGIILTRAHIGESNSSIVVLTEELGLVSVRAQGIRKPGAKLASALTTLSESELMLVRGKEGWRVIGATRVEDWFTKLTIPSTARARAARVVRLLMRLVAGEAPDTELFSIIRGFLVALVAESEARHEAIEILAVLRLLAVLGLEEGGLPDAGAFTDTAMASVMHNRARYITRINTGIAASGL